MRRRICTLLLAGGTLVLPAAGLHAKERQPTQEQPVKKAEISSEDRQVIQHMELLSLLNLLKDMEILKGEKKTVPEGKK
jgi:hypothetical protein